MNAIPKKFLLQTSHPFAPGLIDVVQKVIQRPQTQRGMDPDDTGHIGDSVRVGALAGVLVDSEGLIQLYLITTARDGEQRDPDYVVALPEESVKIVWDHYYKMWRLQVGRTVEELRALPEFVGK